MEIMGTRDIKITEIEMIEYERPYSYILEQYREMTLPYILKAIIKKKDPKIVDILEYYEDEKDRSYEVKYLRDRRIEIRKEKINE